MAGDAANLKDVTEIVFFHNFQLNVSEARSFAVSKGLDGCLRSYHGEKVESETEGVWIQEWLSLGHHIAFQKSPVYPSFVAGASSFADPQQIIIKHVQLQPYPAEEAFSASFTEIIVATLKPESTSEGLETAVKEVEDNSKNLSYGPVLEDSTHKEYIIVRGWGLIGAQQTAVSDSGFYRRLREIAEFNAKVFRLSQ